MEGRTKIYESMVKGENTLEAGTPASFDVLDNEIRGLGLNMQLEKNPRLKPMTIRVTTRQNRLGSDDSRHSSGMIPPLPQKGVNQ